MYKINSDYRKSFHKVINTLSKTPCKSHKTPKRTPDKNQKHNYKNKFELLTKDMEKLLEINKSLQNEIAALRQVKAFSESKLRKKVSKEVHNLKEELKQLKASDDKKDKTIHKLKADYITLENEYKSYKEKVSQTHPNSSEKAYYVKDNQRLLDLIELLQKECKSHENSKN